MTEPFGARLRAAMDERGPLCVGVDPHASVLHSWGLSDDAAGLERFVMTKVDALGDLAAVMKPQCAFFERHGSAGVAVLEKFIEAARAAGVLVLLDAKRGDIGSTMQGYADAYLDPSSPLAVDAVTVSPYLGFGSLQPMVDAALKNGAGVFVLALTSNPEGSQVQHARAAHGTVAGEILASIAAVNAGIDPMGSVGAVVAANLTGSEEDLAINGPLLAPGLGAQGGTVDDVRRLFAGVYDYVLPSTSREISAAGPDRKALRHATSTQVDNLRALLSAQ